MFVTNNNSYSFSYINDCFNDGITISIDKWSNQAHQVHNSHFKVDHKEQVDHKEYDHKEQVANYVKKCAKPKMTQNFSHWKKM